MNKIYFRKYNKPIEKNRYIEFHSNSPNRVNHLNHNTQQGIDRYTLENKYEKGLVNVSDIQLPTYVIDTLKRGEKFSFNNTFDKNLTLQYLKIFETYVNNYIDDEIAPKVRGYFLDTIKKYHNKDLSTRLHNDKKFKIVLEKTKHFIKNHPSILITRADKGNATVVKTKSSYLEKTENLFKDQKSYDEIKKKSSIKS